MRWLVSLHSNHDLLATQKPNNLYQYICNQVLYPSEDIYLSETLKFVLVIQILQTLSILWPPIWSTKCFNTIKSSWTEIIFALNLSYIFIMWLYISFIRLVPSQIFTRMIQHSTHTCQSWSCSYLLMLRPILLILRTSNNPVFINTNGPKVSWSMQ